MRFKDNFKTNNREIHDMQKVENIRYGSSLFHAFVPYLEHKTFKIVFVITISVPILFLLLCA